MSNETLASARHDHGGLLEGRVAIVTGASRGIGAATAHAFADAGATVVLASRDDEQLEATAEQIRQAGGETLAVATDVTDPAAVERLVGRTLVAYGRLDVAFNNASQGHQPTPLADLSVEEFDRALSVNARGVFLAMRYEIATMLTSGGGAIVNMSSTAGLRGVRGIAGYLAGKHAILALTKAAALDYGAHGIRVNAVAPGPIATHRLDHLDERTLSGITAGIPVGRLGQPEEVAAAVTWLCSDKASFISGATIPIDGGKLAGGA